MEIAFRILSECYVRCHPSSFAHGAPYLFAAVLAPAPRLFSFSWIKDNLYSSPYGAGYNYKIIDYINYVFFIGRFVEPLIILLSDTYKVIPTFSRKESQHFRAGKGGIPTFSHKESQHFRAKLQIPTFSRKYLLEKHQKWPYVGLKCSFLTKFSRFVFEESQHFRAACFSYPNIFAQHISLSI